MRAKKKEQPSIDEIITPEVAERCLEEFNYLRGQKWNLDAKLGHGGFGKVYRVTNGETTAAAKLAKLKGCKGPCDVPGVLHNGGCICSHEIEMMRYVGEHPNIIRMYDGELLEVYLDNGKKGVTQAPTDFSLMLMPECMTLSGLQDEKVGLSEEDLRLVAIDMCKALEHCADRFVFHCDVKAANIFAQKTKDGTYNFLLGDFGSATIVNPFVQRPSMFSWTPGYLAPEFAQKYPIKNKEGKIVYLYNYDARVQDAAGKDVQTVEYDPKLINADVFSLGVTLYHMLTYELPDPEVKFGMKKRKRKVTKISEAFEKIICKAVQYDPHDRYASAAEMRRDLEQLKASRDTIVFEFSHFFQAKEYLLAGKLNQAAAIAESGIKSGEPRCELLKAYIQCIRVCRQSEEEGWDLATCRKNLEPVIDEMNRIDKKYNLPMAQFLSGVMYQMLGDSDQFAQNMEQAAARDCIPAVFFWGRILDMMDFGYKGRRREGRALIYKAAEMEYQPALRHVKRHLMRFTEEAGFTDVIWKLLSTVDANDPPEIFEGAVKYL